MTNYLLFIYFTIFYFLSITQIIVLILKWFWPFWGWSVSILIWSDNELMRYVWMSSVLAQLKGHAVGENTVCSPVFLRSGESSIMWVCNDSLHETHEFMSNVFPSAQTDTSVFHFIICWYVCVGCFPYCINRSECMQECGILCLNVLPWWRWLMIPEKGLCDCQSLFIIHFYLLYST